MYETVCYEKSFLKEVIARIDFVAPIDGLEKSLPAKLANVVSTHFPINEPTEAIAQQLQLIIGPDEVKQSRTQFKQWKFYGRDREKTLSLAAPFVFVSYQQYTTYENMKEEFAAIIDAIGKAFPDARTGRFGLRYINSIDIPAYSTPFRSLIPRQIDHPFHAIPITGSTAKRSLIPRQFDH